MLEDAAGDFLIFLECLTYPGLGWPDVACTSMAPEEFLVAQAPSGRACGVLLPSALVEGVGLPPEIILNALLKILVPSSGTRRRETEFKRLLAIQSSCTRLYTSVNS